ncbi:restriction endonuclease subunit S [Cellulosimicrobium sp. PMB13]|uniref:restriction endonuclease subunit S n=1 Tax=Cellulosimicrobium sp. PMB13 TaxID=3120158 RepID=UPI003F4C53EC
MAEWSEVRLGDLVDNFDSKRLPVKSSDRRPGPYPYYGASGVVDWVDGYLLDGEYLLVSEDGENLRSRSTPIAFMADGRFWPNNHVHVLRGKKVSDTRFLKYALAITDLTGFLTGSAQPKLSRGSMDAIRLRVPDAVTRGAIGEVLGALDDKIAANTRLATTAASIMREEYRLALAESHPRHGHFFDFFDVDFGSAFKGEEFSTPGTGRPLLRIRDLKTFVPQVWTTERRSDETVVNPGDIAVGMDGDFSPTPWFGEASVLNQRVCVVRSAHSPALTLEAIRAPIAFIEGHKSGTTVIHLNKKDLAETPVVLPSEAAARSFDAHVSRLLDVQVQAHVESRGLAATRDALLPQLMSGRLRVRDAVEALENPEALAIATAPEAQVAARAAAPVAPVDNAVGSDPSDAEREMTTLW